MTSLKGAQLQKNRSSQVGKPADTWAAGVQQPSKLVEFPMPPSSDDTPMSAGSLFKLKGCCNDRTRDLGVSKLETHTSLCVERRGKTKTGE